MPGVVFWLDYALAGLPFHILILGNAGGEGEVRLWLARKG